MTPCKYPLFKPTSEEGVWYEIGPSSRENLVENP